MYNERKNLTQEIPETAMRSALTFDRSEGHQRWDFPLNHRQGIIYFLMSSYVLLDHNTYNT